jgi:hypothetical protein
MVLDMLILFSRPNTEDSWKFANWGIVQSIGIMAFGKTIQRVYTEATILP